ncbi:MAG: DMT family transporter [Syntrophomonadaceae bacterium]|jgi:DME family drug/metabolite transporter
MSANISGVLYIIVSAFMYATLPILAKLAYTMGLTPGNVLLLRYFFAFAVLFLYIVIISKGPILSFSFWIISQGVCLVLGSLFYLLAVQYIPAGVASVIFFVHPAIVATLSLLLFREKPSWHLFLGLFLAILGIILISRISQGFTGISAWGVCLAIFSSLTYSGYSLISQKNVAAQSPYVLTTTFSLLGIVFFTMVNYTDLDFITSLNIPQLLIGLAMGLFNTVLALVFYLKGVKKIGASHAALVSTLEPVLTVLIAFLVLEEVLTSMDIIGSLLVFASMLLAVTSSRQKPLETLPNKS